MRPYRFFRSIVVWAVMVTASVFASANRPWADESSALSRNELKGALVVDPDPQAQLKTLAKIARQPMSDNDIIIPWIEQNSGRLEPLLLMELVRRTFEQSHADSLEWFAVGYVRTAYDAKRCEDPTAGADLALALFSFAGQPFTSYFASHPDEYGAAQQRALARTDLFSDEVSPAWICVHGMSAYGQAITGQPAQIQIKPREQWPALQQTVRAGMEATVRQALAHQAARKALPAGTIELRIPHKGAPFSLAWSPDGKRLAMTLNGDAHFAIWDVESHSLLQEIDGGMFIADIAFLDGSNEVITSALQNDSWHGLVLTTFSADSGAAIRHFGQIMANAQFAVDATHHAIAYLAGGIPTPAVIVADLNNPTDSKPVTLLQGVPSALAFNADGTLAIGTLDGQIVLLEARTHRLLRTIDAFENDYVESLAFSADGRYIASGGEGGERGVRGDNGEVRLAPVGDSLRVWKVTDGTLTLSCSELVGNAPVSILSVAWSPNGHQLAYTGHSNVHLLDIDAPQRAKVLMQFSQASGHSQYSSQALAFSPDGTRLAMTGDGAALIVPFGDQAISVANEDASCR